MYVFIYEPTTSRGPSFNRPSICRHPDSHTCLFFSFVCLEISPFPSIFCTIALLSLFGEYVVRSFLPDGVFLPCDTGWIFDIIL